MSLRTSRIFMAGFAALTLTLMAPTVPAVAANLDSIAKSSPTPQAAANAMLIAIGGVNKVIDIAALTLENDGSGPVIGKNVGAGTGAGKAKVSALSFTMAAIDASPQFLSELQAKTPLAKIVMHYDGKTYTLLRDKIASVKTAGDRDTVTLAYEEIRVTNGTTGKTASDVWDVAPH